MKRFALASCIGILAFGAANAQEYSRYSFDIGGGYTTPTGSTTRDLNEGWNIDAGAGMNMSAMLGAKVDLGYDSMGVNGITRGFIGVNQGGVHIFHATLDPVVHLTPRRHIDVYVTGGGGVFHMYQNFGSATAANNFTNINNSYLFGVDYGATAGVQSYSVTKPGFDVGAGVDFGSLAHGKFFMEAKWEHMFLNGGHVDFIPATFGFRW